MIGRWGRYWLGLAKELGRFCGRSARIEGDSLLLRSTLIGKLRTSQPVRSSPAARFRFEWQDDTIFHFGSAA